MPRKCVLIVDDQHEVRRMLHAWIETLRPAVDVFSMPSGEEAMLEASRRSIDLMIADVRLPGITGIELMTKIQKRHPAMRVILITGVSDYRIRKQAAEAGAYAFFIKPIEMPDFLDAVERALGLVETSLPAAPIVQPEVELPTLGERLRNLRRRIQGISVTLFDYQGKILEEAGGIEEIVPGSGMLLSILSLCSASAKVNLGLRPSQSIHYLQGRGHDLIVANLGMEHYLAAALPVNQTGCFPEKAASEILAAIPCIGESLASLGGIDLSSEEIPVPLVNGSKKEDTPLPEDLLTATASQLPVETERVTSLEPLSPEEVSDLEEVFRRKNISRLNAGDLESFWDAAAEEHSDKNVRGGAALTFEEAEKLGLAPGSETD